MCLRCSNIACFFATCQLICVRCLLEVVCEGLNERPVSSHSWLPAVTTQPTSLLIPLNYVGENPPNRKRVLLDGKAFHYHPPIVLIRLKYCWNGRKTASHSSIWPSLPFSLLLVRTDTSLLILSGHHLNIFGVRWSPVNNKNYFCQAKRLLGVHWNIGNTQISRWVSGRRI